MSEDISTINSFFAFIISIVSVATIVLGVIQWKIRKILKSSTYQLTTSSDIKSLSEKMDAMNSKIEREIILSREEHARMQAEHYELVKELYKLIGEVKAMKKE